MSEKPTPPLSPFRRSCLPWARAQAEGALLNGSIILTIFLLLFSHPAFSQESDVYKKIGIQSVKNNIKAPDFCLEGLNGKKLQLHSLKGNVILLNFWATWCGPCKEEMPSMEALYQQYKDRGFMLLTISVDEGSPEPTRKFIQMNDYHFPVLIDPTGKTLDVFGVDRIPVTLLIDKKGRILGRAIGPRNWSHPDVFSFIDRLLDDRPMRAVSLRK